MKKIIGKVLFAIVFFICGFLVNGYLLSDKYKKLYDKSINRFLMEQMELKKGTLPPKPAPMFNYSSANI